MKKLTLFAGALILLGSAIYGGRVYGDLLGGHQYYAQMASGDAAFTMATLQKLRSGQVDEGISLLEGQLDILIVNDCTFYPEIEKWLGIFHSETNITSDKLMARVAQYREKHPSNPNPYKTCEKFLKLG